MKQDNASIVLLVVDMQTGFVNDRSRHVIPNVVNAVRIARQAGVAIVFTRFHNIAGSSYESLIGWTRLRNAPETDIVPEVALLRDASDVVIDKTVYSAFTPPFTNLVETRGWSTLAVCGIATDGCVLKTSVDAFERGLRPVVLTDACASHAGSEIHQAGLTLLARFVGRKQLIGLEGFGHMLSVGRPQ